LIFPHSTGIESWTILRRCVRISSIGRRSECLVSIRDAAPSFAHQRVDRGADPRGTVVVGSAIGGIRAGVASVVAVPRLRLRYIPPTRPRCRTPQNWTALAVYVIVMLAWRASSRVWIHRESRRSGQQAAHRSQNSQHCRRSPRRRLAQDHRVGGPRVSRSPESRCWSREGFEVVACAAIRSPRRNSHGSVHTRDSRSALARILNRPGNCAQSPLGIRSRRWHPLRFAVCRLEERSCVLTTFAMTRLWRWSVRNYASKHCARNSLKRLTTFAEFDGAVSHDFERLLRHQSRLFDTGEPLRVTHVGRSTRALQPHRG